MVPGRAEVSAAATLSVAANRDRRTRAFRLHEVGVVDRV